MRDVDEGTQRERCEGTSSADAPSGPVAVPALRRRNVHQDLLGVVACLAVVLLHCSMGVFGSARDAAWARDLAYQCVCVFAVPVFFMVSGASLLGYRERYSTRDFLVRRARKAGAGLVAASLVAYVLLGAFPGSFYAADAVAASFGPLGFVRAFLSNTIEDTYWFLYSILYLYLLTPVLSFVVRRRRLLEGVLALNLLAAFVVPSLRWFLPGEAAWPLFDWPLFASPWTFYYLLGYYLRTYARPSGARLAALVACGACALAAMYVATRVLNSPTRLSAGLWFEGKPYDSTWCGASGILCVPYAAAVFCAAAALEPRLRELPGRALRAIRALSGLTFGIYLFHDLVIRWMGASLAGSRLFAVTLPAHPLAKGLVVFAVTAALVAAGKALLARLPRPARTAPDPAPVPAAAPDRKARP